jgi:hypothetical protein
LQENVPNVDRVIEAQFETRDLEVLLAAAGAIPLAEVSEKD